MKSISFARHVHKELTPYRLGVSVVVSILIAFAFAIFALGSRASSDQQVLEALSPYLATLVETADRPEILRVLGGVKENRKADLVLVQNGQVYASTRNISEMDLPFADSPKGLSLIGSRFTSSEITSRLPVLRQNGPSQNAQIYSFSPLRPTLLNALGISVVTLLLSLLISLVSARQTRRAVKGALKPLDQLHREIQGLSLEEARDSDPIQIRELEEIRRTISKTKHDLANARERLAEEKARKLTADAYRTLIHDLHNPASALRRNVALWNDPATDEETRKDASESVSRIADQILNQVSAAKGNLENDPLSLRENDIRDCVKESVRQVQMLGDKGSKKHVSLKLPDGPVIVAHDPSLLQRAIVNLLENGIEAGKEQVELALEQSNGRACIRVSDDGPGMDESQLAIFFQGRGQSNKANRQALGLTSTNHIVRTHGGKLVYKPSDLGGASFEIRLEVAT
jgi:signal transduction histidine kinase